MNLQNPVQKQSKTKQTHTHTLKKKMKITKSQAIKGVMIRLP